MKKPQSEVVYNQLKAKGLSDEEIAEAFVFPGDWLSPEQRREADEALRKAIAEHRANMSEEEKEQIEAFRKKLLNQADI
jgi:hypothetical protein